MLLRCNVYFGAQLLNLGPFGESGAAKKNGVEIEEMGISSHFWDSIKRRSSDLQSISKPIDQMLKK